MSQEKEAKTHPGILKKKYANLVDSILISRAKVVFPIAIVLQILYTGLDRIVYPAQVGLFLKIRIISCILSSIFFIFIFLPLIRKYKIYVFDFISLFFSLSLCFMVYLTDGTQSPYFSGVALVILGTGVINSFYFKHNLTICILDILAYNAAMIFSKSPFSYPNFIFSNNFILAPALFMILLTRYSGTQHFNAFVSSEELNQKKELLEILYQKTEKLSRTDDLTQLFNRRHFFNLLRERIQSSESYKLSFFLVLVDVDHFKQLNDIHGHAFGDEVLMQAAKTMKNNLRPGDFLGRFGGDEFMIVFSGSDNLALAKRMNGINDKIRNLNISSPVGTVELSLTFGAFGFSPDRSIDEETLFKNADKQLYIAKQNQRGSISISSSL